MKRALLVLALLAAAQLAPAAVAISCNAGEGVRAWAHQSRCNAAGAAGMLCRRRARTAMRGGDWLLAHMHATSPNHAPAPPAGVKKYELLNFLGALLNTTQREPACEPCGWQQVSPGGDDAECAMCEPFVSAPNSAKTACECLPGAYVAGPAAKGGSGSTCAACANNAISTTKNADTCKVCPAGAVAERGTKCVCATGYVATGFGDDGVTGCRACGDNEVSPGGASRTCSACPAGALPLADKSACGCPAGQRMLSAEPLKCAACTTVFEVTRDANRLMLCQQCSPFSYANEDHTGCVCAAGYFARNPEAASVHCSQCPEGTHKPTAGNGGVEACLACPAGLTSSTSRKQCGEQRQHDACTHRCMHVAAGRTACLPLLTICAPWAAVCVHQ